MNKTIFHIHGTIDKKIAYFLAPKCGCSTMREWLILINNPILLNEVSKKAKESKEDFLKILKEYKLTRKDYVKAIYISPQEVIKYDVRFCVVRDPIERFVSTYKQLVKYSKSGLRGIGVDEYISLTEKNYNEVSTLYSDLKESDWNNIRHHFKAQYEFYGANHDIFSHIFNINEMEKVRDILIETTGVNFPYLHLNRTKGKLEDVFLTDLQKEWVKKTYSVDYDVYKKWM